jgi:hypothetical protein
LISWAFKIWRGERELRRCGKFRCKIFRKHASWWCIAHSVSPRLATDFHQNHATSPLAILVGDLFLAGVFGGFPTVKCASVKAAAFHMKYELPLFIATFKAPNSAICRLSPALQAGR